MLLLQSANFKKATKESYKSQLMSCNNNNNVLKTEKI